MKINKKMLLSGGILLGLTLLCKTSYAETLAETLENYYNNYQFDFMGRTFDKILFQDILDSSVKGKQTDAELIAKLKFIIEDIKTMPIQAKCAYKIITDESNSLVYLGLGSTAYAKLTMGAKAFNELLLKVIKAMK